MTAAGQPRITWPPKAVDMLRELWKAGATGKQIAEQINAALGTKLTKSAVISKTHRLLDLNGRPSPIKAKKPTRLNHRPAAKSRDPRRLQKPLAGREEDHRAKLPARPEAASEAVRANGGCAWLEGERPNWTRCGEPCLQGSSWCPSHHGRVFQTGILGDPRKTNAWKSGSAGMTATRESRKHFNKHTDSKWGL